jgi:EpsI family protein
MTARLLMLSACFLLAAGYTARAMRPEIVPLRQSLASLPVTLDQWSGYDQPRFSDEILATLGVDEYLNRTYVASGSSPIALYVGYYRSQRQGDTIHSPMNCLPGAGWEPVVTRRIAVPIRERETPIQVNQVIVQKGLDRHLVLYWYQSQSRVVASEYWSKFYMVYDAIRTNRSDGALVRVVTPMSSGRFDDPDAERRAVEFVQTLFPHLGRYLPS